VVSRYTWARTAEGYLRAIAAAGRVAARQTLPIPKFFTDPRPENRISLSELERVYGTTAN